MTDQLSIENLDIDGVNYNVAELPEDIQAAVTKYEEWRDRFAIAQDEAAIVAGALRDLGAQIVAAIRANEAQEQAEEAADLSEVAEVVVDEEPLASRADTLVVDDA